MPLRRSGFYTPLGPYPGAISGAESRSLMKLAKKRQKLREAHEAGTCKKGCDYPHG